MHNSLFSFQKTVDKPENKSKIDNINSKGAVGFSRSAVFLF